MNLVNEIENRLVSISSTEFEKLCFQYFSAEGYSVHVYGVVAGKNKSKKGKPDMYIFENGKYIFIECTTNVTSNFKKLKKDLEDCFDVKKTKIENSLINEIKLCFNFLISPLQNKELRDLAIKKSCKLSIMDLSILSIELKRKHPDILKDFFEIPYDTNQILKSKQFIKEYQKNKFSIRLDNEFIFRKDELKIGLEQLYEKNVLIIRGDPGTGKTKFALKLLEQFRKKNSTFKEYVIMNKGINLYDDSNRYFQRKGKYIVLIDDANRGISNLETILRLLINEKIEIKIIITVRNYAFKKIESIVDNYEHSQIIEIKNFSYDELKELILKFNNFTYRVIDKIYDITKGNPRLAIMSTKLVLEENNILVLYNVANIFENYFGKVFDEIEKLQNPIYLKVLGIISFLRVINNDDAETFQKIQDTFEISKTNFWDIVYELNAQEIIDLYENQYAKFSDQSFQSYIFYKVFFEKEILDYGKLLVNFSNEFKNYQLILDTLNPALSNFNSTFIKDKLIKHYFYWIGLYKDYKLKRLKVLKYFWFVSEENSLKIIEEEIKALPSAKLDNIDFDIDTQKLYKSSYNSDHKLEYFDVLKQFKQSFYSFSKSLELMFNLLKKYPDLYGWLLKYFKEELIYDRDSFDERYHFQISLFNFLLEKSKRKNKLFENITFKIANIFLETSYRTGWSRGKRSFVMATVNLILNEEIKKLRESIIKYIFNDFKNKEKREKILNFLEKYVQPQGYEIQRNIYHFDSEFIIPFIKSNFESNNFHHCKIVNDYIRFLEKRNDYANLGKLKIRFQNQTYKTYKLLKWDEQRELRMKMNELSMYQAKKLKKKFFKFTFSDYVTLIVQVEEIKKIIKGYDAEQINSSLDLVLDYLAQSNIVLFIKLINKILDRGNKATIIPYKSLGTALSLNNKFANQIFRIVNKSKYEQKYAWQLLFFTYLPENLVNKKYLDHFYRFITNRFYNYYCIVNFDFFKKYESVDKNVFFKTLRYLLIRTKIKGFKVDFRYLLYHLEDNDYILNKFKDKNLNLLKKIYLYQLTVDEMDYSRKIFSYIVRKDINFILEYLTFKYKEKTFISRHDEHGNFKILWELKEYEQVISKALAFCQKKEMYSVYGDEFFTVFFKNVPMDNKVECYIKKYIRTNVKKIKNLNTIFSIVESCYPDKRIFFLKYLFETKPDFNNFENLFLEKKSWSGSGSLIPAYEKCKIFWEEVEQLLIEINRPQFLSYVKSNIEKYEHRIKYELKRDFIEED